MTEPVAAADDFQRELLELFAAEAYEWLTQIQQALARFQASSDPSVKFDALDIISRGITSLGGSAATVDLPAIQELVFGLLPLLEQLRGPASADASDTLANLRDSLANITDLVTSNTGMPATVTFEAHKPDVRQAKEFLQALHALRRAQMYAVHVSRSVTDSVIRRVQQDVEHGLSKVDAPTILAQLDDVCRSNDDFVHRVQSALPGLCAAVTAMKSMHHQPVQLLPADQTTKWLHTVDQLTEQARQREATPLQHFFQGLSSFIKIVTERRLAVSAQRFGAVETRLNGIASIAHAWLEAERAEREAIVQLLAA
jgi:chemotaxis protein histidine kinase CheA